MPRDEHIYVRAYFRVESGYVWGQGMPKEKSWAFYFEIIRILDSIGFKSWKKSGSGSCFEGFRGSCESLYCHPQDLVGWVRKDKIDEIAEALRHGSTFSLYHVDTYDEAHNYSSEELKTVLAERKQAIEEQLLERFKTPMRNLYKLPDLDIKTGIAYFAHNGELRRIVGLFVQGTFEELVAGGKIAKAEKVGKAVFRTAVPMTSSVKKKRHQSDTAGSSELFSGKEVTECQV